MGKYPTPTLEDLARLLDTAAGGDYYRGARDTAHWLIEESAPELYSELGASSGDEPSAMELARLISAVTSQQPIPEALDAAYWLIAQSELASAHLARLDQLASDTGEARKKCDLMQILDDEAELDRLLAANDDWQHPSDVLDPTRNRGINCRVLYSLCCARLERSEGGERRQLETVRHKLERPAELERLLPVFGGRRFDSLQKWLAEVQEPETAVDSLEEMGRVLRSALASPGSRRA